ncbi:MAG TPA: hypothetical protein VGG33_01755, partial [Polyangia bacterium]
MATGKGRIALFILLGLGMFGAAAAGFLIHGLRRVSDEVRSAPGFAAAWEQVAANPTLIEVMGPPDLAPFDPIAFLQGRQSWRFTSHAKETVVPNQNTLVTRRDERTEIEVPITGARGKGTLSIESQQVDGAWRVDRLEARVDGRSGALNLLAAAAPPGGIKTTKPGSPAPPPAPPASSPPQPA